MKAIELRKAEKLSGEKFALYRMINPATVSSQNLMSFLVVVDVGGGIPEHQHGPAEVALHFLQGRASVTVDGEEKPVQPGVAVLVPIGSSIGLRNTGQRRLQFIAAISPPIGVNVCPVCGIEIKG